MRAPIEGRAGARALAARLAVCATIVAGGCAHPSEYTPFPDGRARVLWRGDNVVADLGGARLLQPCADEIGRITATDRLRLDGGTLRLDPPAGYWVPVYYGPPIVAVRAGLAPPLVVHPLFVPRLPAPGLHAGPRLGGYAGGGGGGASRVGRGGDGRALVVLAVIALVVLPAVDLGLAFADPENPERSSEAIDQVNAYNDLARWPGSPCAYASWDGSGP